MGGRKGEQGREEMTKRTESIEKEGPNNLGPSLLKTNLCREVGKYRQHHKMIRKGAIISEI